MFEGFKLKTEPHLVTTIKISHQSGTCLHKNLYINTYLYILFICKNQKRNTFKHFTTYHLLFFWGGGGGRGENQKQEAY